LEFSSTMRVKTRKSLETSFIHKKLQIVKAISIGVKFSEIIRLSIKVVVLKLKDFQEFSKGTF